MHFVPKQNLRKREVRKSIIDLDLPLEFSVEKSSVGVYTQYGGGDGLLCMSVWLKIKQKNTCRLACER